MYNVNLFHCIVYSIISGFLFVVQSAKRIARSCCAHLSVWFGGENVDQRVRYVAHIQELNTRNCENIKMTISLLRENVFGKLGRALGYIACDSGVSRIVPAGRGTIRPVGKGRTSVCFIVLNRFS